MTANAVPASRAYGSFEITGDQYSGDLDQFVQTPKKSTKLTVEATRITQVG